MEKSELIYELMSGVIATDRITDSLKDKVVNEFAAGEACEKMYRDVYEAKCRLNDRLGTDEDEDVELIIDQMFNIAKHLCMKMYEYAK